MLQSQLESARCNTKGTPPSKGVRIRDYALIDAAGNSIELSGYRGKQNLVLLFTGARESGETVATRLRSFEEEFIQADAVVVIVVADEPAWVSGLPHVLIASDVRAIAHKEIGGPEASAKFVQGCFITDRFGEVYTALHEIPPVSEMLRWLDYINSECPECEPSEWPIE
jgi:peroxiredoxin